MAGDKPLAGKVALVTGASRGIGADIAKHLGAAGASVAVTARSETVSDPRLPGTIHTVASEIESAGGTAKGFRMDMRDEESIVEGLKQVLEHFGRVDIVVNNAALLVGGTLETVKPRHIELLYEINLRGPITLLREAIPHMRAGGGGHIINVSSRGAVFPGPGPYPADARKGGWLYGGLKAGLERMSQGWAIDLQGDNISVNVLSPQGVIRTPGNKFITNDKENPDTDFEEADKMGKAAVYICQQPVEFTGNILFDEPFCAEKGL